MDKDYTTTMKNRISQISPTVAVLALAGAFVATMGTGCGKKEQQQVPEQTQAADKRSDSLKSASDKISDAAKDAGDKIKTESQRVGEKVSDAAEKAWDATKTQAQKASNTIKESSEKVSNALKSIPPATNDTRNVP
jgi:hypothetical protein